MSAMYDLDSSIKFTKIKDCVWLAEYHYNGYVQQPVKEPLIYENRLAAVRALKSVGVARKNIHIEKTILKHDSKYIVTIQFDDEADEAVFVMNMMVFNRT